MAESHEPQERAESALQFDSVEGAQPGGVNCDLCATALTSEYHELNGQPVCAVCRAREEAIYAEDRKGHRFLVAAAYGFGAAIVGGILYYAFVKITGIELGLMAIAIGWLVGRGVMKGSNYRGGRRYQIAALALTYFSITISYGALIVEYAMKNPQGETKAKGKTVTKEAEVKDTAESKGAEAPVTAGEAALGLGFFFLIVLASPFLAGFSNILGWVIIAIGLFEAWKQTREAPFVTGGPYRFGTEPGATAAEAS